MGKYEQLAKDIIKNVGGKEGAVTSKRNYSFSENHSFF